MSVRGSVFLGVKFYCHALSKIPCWELSHWAYVTRDRAFIYTFRKNVRCWKVHPFGMTSEHEFKGVFFLHHVNNFILKVRWPDFLYSSGPSVELRPAAVTSGPSSVQSACSWATDGGAHRATSSPPPHVHSPCPVSPSNSGL